MPNLYATPIEIKAAMADAVQDGTTKYDAILLRLSGIISRFIDKHCRRTFYPQLATRYFDGDGREALRVPDLLSITSVSYSEDDGSTYTALTSADYYATVEGDWNSTKSYTVLVVSDLSNTLAVWPSGQRSIKVVGIWAYADDRDAAWEDSADTVENNPLTAAGTSITVNDADGADLFGVTPRFQAGQLLKIESEFLENTVVIASSTNTVAVVRSRNGTAGAAHAQNTTMYIWRPPEPVKQACVIQAVRQMERGFQGFGEARANADIGQMFWIKSLDPEAKELLQMYVG